MAGVIRTKTKEKGYWDGGVKLNKTVKTKEKTLKNGATVKVEKTKVKGHDFSHGLGSSRINQFSKKKTITHPNGQASATKSKDGFGGLERIGLRYGSNENDFNWNKNKIIGGFPDRSNARFARDKYKAVKKAAKNGTDIKTGSGTFKCGGKMKKK